MDELELDETTTHWLAIIGVLTLGVALIFLLARKIAR